MKLIIDIPEEEYNTGQLLHYFGCYSDKLDLVIYNGTSLPEHHGRLKDIDAFVSKVKADMKHSAYLRSWTADDVLNALNNSYAPTIIEGSESE